MSKAEELNYPPEELYKQTWNQKKNIEHIILWMLKNNEIVEWSDFKEDPISIAQSTLSNYISKLDNKGYVEKIKRGYYQITSKGEVRYNDLSRSKYTKRKLSYPPDIIRASRNYNHIILWMAYNNYSLKWSDFTEESSLVKINQSSLSKNLNLLMDNEFLRKDDNREYKITQTGKSEYSRILKFYDLDRQSILNEESKRIEEITKMTIKFFEEYDIQDDNIKFRFLHNVLTLPFEKLKGSLDKEEDFNKILLFISINHPNQYPNYISSVDFSRKYKIDQLDLEFNIRRIVEKNIYSIEFFKIKVAENRIYYFQANEKIEKILNAITEDHISKFTYLNKLYEKTSNGTPQLTLSFTVDAILEEICDNLFNLELKESLREFLPEYINYLAYKIETKKKLVELSDKVEGSVWQEFQYFRSVSPSPKYIETSEENYYLYPKLFDTLEPYYLTPDISFTFEKSKKLIFKKEYQKAFDMVENAIKSGQKDLGLVFLKAIILSRMHKYREVLVIINEETEFEGSQNDEYIYIPAAFIRIFGYTALGDIKTGLEITEDLLINFPDHPISHAAKALILGFDLVYDFHIEEDSNDFAFDEIDKAIRLESNIPNKARFLEFKCTILEQMEKYEEALDTINSAIDLKAGIVDLIYTKAKILVLIEKHEEAVAVLEDAMIKFPKSKKYLLMQQAYVLKMSGNLDDGLSIVEDLIKSNPSEHEFMHNKAYWHLYKYQENKKKGITDEENKAKAIETVNKLTEITPNVGNYFDSYGEILMRTGDYEYAIKMFNKAIVLEPNGWFVSQSYAGIGKCYEKLDLIDKAEEYLLKAKEIVGIWDCHFKNRKEWMGDVNYHLDKIKSLKQNS
ncbi:hypothetical protein LCGC14_1172780 [marine sediment metagenome]|uniref:Uncharacterized protein n=1 Tax=marine sediment metagenome TaxID=412755 RepID=A0A0F9PUV9_9ZZZZ